MAITNHLKIIEGKVVNRLDLPLDLECRQRQILCALQIALNLIIVIQVQMRIAAGPNELFRNHVRQVRDHVSQQ